MNQQSDLRSPLQGFLAFRIARRSPLIQRVTSKTMKHSANCHFSFLIDLCKICLQSPSFSRQLSSPAPSSTPQLPFSSAAAGNTMFTSSGNCGYQTSYIPSVSSSSPGSWSPSWLFSPRLELRGELAPPPSSDRCQTSCWRSNFSLNNFKQLLFGGAEVGKWSQRNIFLNE